MAKSSSPKCWKTHPENCAIHGVALRAAKNGDINAYLAAKEKEDKNSDMKSFFGEEKKKEDRSNPPGSLKVEEGDGYAIFMTSDGKFYEKQYDQYGAGVGSHKISGMFTGKLKKAAKEQIAEAWELHDKLELQRVAAEKRDASVCNCKPPTTLFKKNGTVWECNKCGSKFELGLGTGEESLSTWRQI